MKIKSPPLTSNGLEYKNFKHHNTKMYKEFICYLVYSSNDFQQKNTTFIISSYYFSGKGSIVYKNQFRDWCMFYTIRTLPIVTWYNSCVPYFQSKIKKEQ